MLIFLWIESIKSRLSECMYIRTHICTPSKLNKCHLTNEAESLEFVVVKSRLTLCDPVDCRHQASLPFSISRSLLRFKCIELVTLSTSSSVIPFSSYLQSFPALGSVPMSQLFTLGGQRIGASASASVLPTNIQG